MANALDEYAKQAIKDKDQMKMLVSRMAYADPSSEIAKRIRDDADQGKPQPDAIELLTMDSDEE